MLGPRSFFFLCFCAVSLAFQPLGNASESMPFTLQNGLIVLRVDVGGRPLSFVFDTGSEATLIDKEVARSLNLALGRSERINGVHAQTTGNWISNFSGAVGGQPLPSKVLALDLSLLSGGLPIDGLIGADFLRGKVVQIDYRRMVVRFLQSSQREATARLKKRGGVYCVRVSVEDSEEAWVRLDTGCVEAMQWCGGGALRDRSRSTSVGLAGRAVAYHNARVTVGDKTVVNVRTGLHSKPLFPGESGLLGNGFLSGFVVTIDVDRGWLTLQ